MIIAGNKNLNPFLKENSDGILTIEETYLPTPHIHKIINKGHSTILYSKRICSLIINFFYSERNTKLELPKKLI